MWHPDKYTTEVKPNLSCTANFKKLENERCKAMLEPSPKTRIYKKFKEETKCEVSLK